MKAGINDAVQSQKKVEWEAGARDACIGRVKSNGRRLSNGDGAETNVLNKTTTSISRDFKRHSRLCARVTMHHLRFASLHFCERGVLSGKYVFSIRRCLSARTEGISCL